MTLLFFFPRNFLIHLKIEYCIKYWWLLMDWCITFNWTEYSVRLQTGFNATVTLVAWYTTVPEGEQDEHYHWTNVINTSLISHMHTHKHWHTHTNPSFHLPFGSLIIGTFWTWRWYYIHIQITVWIYFTYCPPGIFFLITLITRNIKIEIKYSYFNVSKLIS